MSELVDNRPWRECTFGGKANPMRKRLAAVRPDIRFSNGDTACVFLEFPRSADTACKTIQDIVQLIQFISHPVTGLPCTSVFSPILEDIDLKLRFQLRQFICRILNI